MTEGRVEIHDEFPNSHRDPLIRKLHTVIHYCVRALAVLMVVVIMLGVLDVVYVGYQAISSSYVFAIAAVVLALGLAYFLSPARRTGGATVEWHRCRYPQGPRSQQPLFLETSYAYSVKKGVGWLIAFLRILMVSSGSISG